MDNRQTKIEAIWDNRELLKEESSKELIRTVIADLDSGELRCASPSADGWVVNDWVKKAVILYFPIQKMK